LKTDTPGKWAGQNNASNWHKNMRHSSFANAFIDSMDKRGRCIAPILAKKIKFLGYHNVLDIGGGSGVYSAKLLLNSETTKATIIEKPPVDDIVKTYIDKQRLSRKIKVIGMDFFEMAFPVGFDMHLYSHVLHDWGEDKVKILLRKSYAALAKRGHIVILDAHLNAAKTGPLEVAELSVFLMCTTEGKCYSRQEISRLLKETGFKNIKYVDMHFAYRSIIIAEK
jgi:SAM-dependent methyltransferase